MTKAAEVYEGLEFQYTEMDREITSFMNLASRFITRDSARIADTWARQLKDFRDNNRTQIRWEIPERTPIRTILSEGEYEAKKGKCKSVEGRVSSVWEIHKVMDRAKRGKKVSDTRFCLNGLASTKLSILSDNEVVMCWTMDIGDARSPGSHFHSQFKSQHPDMSKFPVPRVPSILCTPMDALDFLLGELFQAKWSLSANKSQSDLGLWSRYQRGRMLNLLSWMKTLVESSSHAPWLAIKSGKPRFDLLVGK